MFVFIDDLYTVRIEYTGYIHDVKVVAMEKPLKWKATEGAFQWFYSESRIPLNQADKIVINGVTYPLHIGLVTLTDLFDQTFRYDGPLGAVWTKTHTDFYVFSPVAKEIKLVVSNQVYPMKSDGNIYHVKVLGDLSFMTYYYEVRLVDTFEKVIDPYAKMALNERGVVVPTHRTARPTPVSLKDQKEAIIYESHVRDVSITLDVSHPGLFLGMTEYNETLNGSVIDYIKSLEMTHIQLLPVFDFEGVDPIFKSRFYNWGYNPKHYFALQPWFSSQPSNPEITIRDFITLIDDIHNHGLGVIMDVVYNHVFDDKTYPYDSLVPGYFYRHDEMYQRTNGSFCGNDVETRRYMVRRLIIDSLSHFVKTYQIDGFRFDLMGLMDVDTINMIRDALTDLNPHILLYGEGWHMDSMLGEREKASQKNYDLMPSIAHFNDTFRNLVKGDLHGPSLGYGTGGHVDLERLIILIKGSNDLFIDPMYSINYVECHDNATLYDKMAEDLKDTTRIKPYQMFTNALLSVSNGMLFYHAGQEMFRSKQGVENSYRSPDAINALTYDLGDHIDIFKAFIKYRKQTYNQRMTFEIIKDGILIHKGNDVIIVKTSWESYTYEDDTRTLYVSTRPVSVKEHQYLIQDVGVYIFIK